MAEIVPFSGWNDVFARKSIEPSAENWFMM